MSKVIEALLRAIRGSKEAEEPKAKSRLMCTHGLCTAECPICGKE